MKKYLIIPILSLVFLSFEKPSNNLPQTAERINWISIEEAYAKAQTHPKKTLVDVYTSWCGWCKVMDRETFSHPAVVKYVNENYYAVKLDAESQDDITVGEKTYKYQPENRANEAAITLLGGKMSYPSIVYLDENFNMIQPIPGYMEAKQFHEVITFLAGDHFKNEPFEKFKSGTYIQKYKNQIGI